MVAVPAASPVVRPARLHASRLRDSIRSADPAIGASDIATPTRSDAAVDLYWIPLGAGGHVVRVSGWVDEAAVALARHRPRSALFHSALEVRTSEGRWVIESAPIRDRSGRERGVVAEGPVGTRWAGRFRVFRYEIRRWKDGTIPDASFAVSSPIRVTDDPASASRVVDTVPAVPSLVWGRDELGAGDMWNSNSLVSWTLACAGIATDGMAATGQPGAGMGRGPRRRAPRCSLIARSGRFTRASRPRPSRDT